MNSDKRGWSLFSFSTFSTSNDRACRCRCSCFCRDGKAADAGPVLCLRQVMRDFLFSRFCYWIIIVYICEPFEKRKKDNCLVWSLLIVHSFGELKSNYDLTSQLVFCWSSSIVLCRFSFFALISCGCCVSNWEKQRKSTGYCNISSESGPWGTPNIFLGDCWIVICSPVTTHLTRTKQRVRPHKNGVRLLSWPSQGSIFILCWLCQAYRVSVSAFAEERNTRCHLKWPWMRLWWEE